MKLQKKLLMIFSFTALIAGCGVPRPDTDLCVHNLPGLRLICVNLKKHYGDDGKLKPNLEWKTYNYQGLEALEKYMRETKTPTMVQFQKVSEMDEVLNKRTSVNPDGLANLKAYIRKMREFCQ